MYDIKQLERNLSIRGFIPVYIGSAAEAADYVVNLIGSGATVGMGGSMTAVQMHLPEKLIEAGNTVYSHSTVPAEQRDDVYRLAANAQWYLSSANAITQGGDIINIDGAANRVSALAYGVKNIVYVIGVNKITADIESGIERIRNVASPLNTRRLGKKTPCAVTGKCSYCNSPDCICNVTTIMHHPTRHQNKVYVIIIGEELGY